MLLVEQFRVNYILNWSLCYGKSIRYQSLQFVYFVFNLGFNFHTDSILDTMNFCASGEDTYREVFVTPIEMIFLIS